MKTKLKLKKKFKIILLLILIILSIIIFQNITKEEKKDKDTNQKTPSTTKKIIKQNKQKAKLTLIGDLLFEQPFYDAINSGYDSSKYFEIVNNDYFKKDDLTIGNMEVVIGNDSLEVSGTGYSFCAPSSMGNLIANQSIEILGTANNHSYDRGIDGINSTIDFFKNNSNIMTVGTYNDTNKRNNLYIKNINGIKIGFLAYTMGTNSKIPNNLREKVGLFRDPDTRTVTEEYKKILKNEITNLRESVDVVIVLMHWGKEFTYQITEEQTYLANYLNNLGVDIIIGSHSHNIQKIEEIGENHKTLVYYSMGNFVSADPIVDRANQEFLDNYQIGLLSTLTITKQNESINITNIKTEPIINYYDKNQNNFLLIPLNQYSETYEKNHYLYNKGLTKQFIENTFEKIIDQKYR